MSVEFHLVGFGEITFQDSVSYNRIKRLTLSSILQSDVKLSNAIPNQN